MLLRRAPAADHRQVPLPAVQLGIDIDFYASPGANIAPTARQDIAYIKSLHANAVSISFPFYSDKSGRLSARSPKTPSMAQLDTLITMAEKRPGRDRAAAAEPGGPR